MKRLIILLIAAILAAHPAFVFADDWPKLKNGDEYSQCSQALEIARTMFFSDEYVLYAPPVIPDKFGSALVLSPKALDISGGNALKANETVFAKIPIPAEYNPRSFYWQKTAMHGYRLVIREESLGWRGDMYSLYAIEEKYKPEDFHAQIKDNSEKFKPVIFDLWRPPLVLGVKDTGELWFINVGQPYEFMPDWQIYASGKTGVKPVCSIQFHPAYDNVTKLLPAPVKNFAVLLDKTMGSGKGEGTLQTTGTMRKEVQETWANIIMRPWTLKEPFNTREEVDAGLKNWSRRNLKHYQSIKQQYPKAENALAEYYQAKFKLSPQKAKIQSAYAMDIALRSHFEFHSDDPNKFDRFKNVNRNPWRKE